jgi:hypothetical protein
MSRPPLGSTNFDTEKAIPQKRLQPFLEFFGILITRQYTTPWRVKQAGGMPAQSNRIWNDLYINTVNGSHALAWKSIPEQDQCGTAPIEGHGRVVGNIRSKDIITGESRISFEEVPRVAYREAIVMELFIETIERVVITA